MATRTFLCNHTNGQFRYGRLYYFDGHIPVLARSAMRAGYLMELFDVEKAKPKRRGRPRKGASEVAGGEA